jgi:hypothetical protein
MLRRLLLLSSSLFIICAHSTFAVTFLVTTNGDSGPGSLRQAILDANATPGPDFIHFSIGTGPQTVAPLSPLPIITDTVDIDGSTQPGYSGTPIIQILGSSVAVGSAGLHLQCTASAIIALHVQGFDDGSGISINGGGQHLLVGNFIGTSNLLSQHLYGIVVSNSVANQIGLAGPGNANVISLNRICGLRFVGSSSNVVEGNYIGTDSTGLIRLDNRGDGIALLDGSSHNSIGGMAPGVRNLISGNWGYGIHLSRSPSNTIEGNYIGLDATGTRAFYNLRGIHVFDSAAITIGGGTAAARNVISGNAIGIEIAGVGSRDTVVQGNYIGVDATALVPLPNQGAGMLISETAEILIGGGESRFGNIISGNLGYGIGMVFARQISVQANVIGLNHTGTAALANRGAGVLLSDCWENLIGGAEPGERNIVSGNHNSGIQLDGVMSTGNTIQGNFVGTTVSGDAAAPNLAGVVLNGALDNAIQNNVISGNASTGLQIGGRSNVVVGNLIGIDASGSIAIPNGGDGIFMYLDDSTIGATEPESRNVISGNGGHGIQLPNLDASHNVIQGNYIGLNAAGASAIPNQGFGIVTAARETTIGGSEAGARNVISGNASGGVAFVGDAITNVLHGNFIGTDDSGQFGVPNRGPGALLISSARNNFIGGTTPGEGNIIAFNTGDGVLVEGNPVGNAIQGNSIHSNGKLGINLKLTTEATGLVTPNDVGDNDGGPNNLQNYPVITNVVYLSNNTIIQGYLRSSTNGSFSIDVYANVATEQSGYGEGQFYLGNVDVDTDESGFTEFAFSAGSAFSNQFFTATALNYATADTSEFSAAMGGIRITAIERIASQYRVSFSTITNRTYVLQRASNLDSSMSWSPVVVPPQPIQGTGGIVTVSDTTPGTDTMRVYRVFQQP